MNLNIIFAICAFLGGSIIALGNALLSAKALRTGSNKALLVTIVRQALNIIYLTAVFLIARKSSCTLAFPLIGAAVGLTVPSVLFAISIAKKEGEKQASDKIAEGDEN